jgi:hypothetical protein
MSVTVHGGSLGRWFEELCRIKHNRLRDVVVSANRAITPRTLPKEGGVYVFWWTGGRQLLLSSAFNRKLELVGPGGQGVSLEIDDEWLGLSTNLPVPLYVGKTARGISRRVGKHLMLGTERILPLGGGARKAKRPTTSCQLRAGIEHLFPRTKDARALVLDNVGLSYVVLSGENHAANRFYLEDLAIGLMRPPLNVDIER